MVVAVTNELEMSSLQSKAFTVIKKISIKEKMKVEAASVLGKAARLYLNIKKHRSIKAQNVYRLNRKILTFKNLRRYEDFCQNFDRFFIRQYRSEENSNDSEDIFREFERMKNTNKEIMMFLSVVAKMISVSKENIMQKLVSNEDKLITNVLIDYKNREDMQLLKEQSILNDYVITNSLKKNY